MAEGRRPLVSSQKDIQLTQQAPLDAAVWRVQGFQQQTAKWPVQPVEVAARWLRSKSADSTVADFGCGDARLAALARQTVLSLDLVSSGPGVIACNIAHTPLGAPPSRMCPHVPACACLHVAYLARPSPALCMLHSLLDSLAMKQPGRGQWDSWCYDGSKRRWLAANGVSPATCQNLTWVLRGGATRGALQKGL